MTRIDELLAELIGLQDTITHENERGRDVAALIEQRDAKRNEITADVAAMLEALESIENDDGRIPAAVWEMRNAAIAKARGDSDGD